MVEFNGVAHGKRIDLDEPLPYSDGTRVKVQVSPEPRLRKGSPRAILELAGTLTDEEADAILKAARECRRVDESLWSDPR